MTDVQSRLLDVFRDFGGDALRDVWLFDQRTHENLYVREDVDAALAELNVETFVDNERYGYVTRDTYEALYYAEYDYTVRGFSSFEQFRTFVGREWPVGLFASFDADRGRYDFSALNEAVHDACASVSTDELRPSRLRTADD